MNNNQLTYREAIGLTIKGAIFDNEIVALYKLIKDAILFLIKPHWLVCYNVIDDEIFELDSSVYIRKRLEIIEYSKLDFRTKTLGKRFIIYERENLISESIKDKKYQFKILNKPPENTYA